MGIETIACRLETTEYTSLLPWPLEHLGTQSKQLPRLHPFFLPPEHGRTHSTSSSDRRAATALAPLSARHRCPRVSSRACAETHEGHSEESSARPAPARARILQPCWMTAACCFASQRESRADSFDIAPCILAELRPKAQARAPEPHWFCSSRFASARTRQNGVVNRPSIKIDVRPLQAKHLTSSHPGHHKN